MMVFWEIFQNGCSIEFFCFFSCLVLCSYQLEALDKAIRENTIVFLETGSGKTLIAIMLLRSYAHYLRKSHPSPYIAVFLVPKVVLVTQVCTTLSLLFVPLQILDTLFDFYLMIEEMCYFHSASLCEFFIFPPLFCYSLGNSSKRRHLETTLTWKWECIGEKWELTSGMQLCGNKK